MTFWFYHQVWDGKTGPPPEEEMVWNDFDYREVKVIKLTIKYFIPCVFFFLLIYVTLRALANPAGAYTDESNLIPGIPNMMLLLVFMTAYHQIFYKLGFFPETEEVLSKTKAIFFGKQMTNNDDPEVETKYNPEVETKSTDPNKTLKNIFCFFMMAILLVLRHWLGHWDHYFGAIYGWLPESMTGAYVNLCRLLDLIPGNADILVAPTPANVIRGIPDMRITMSLFRELKQEDKMCAICLERFKENEMVKVLKCKHMFHEKCLVPWLKKRRTCPTCRRSVITTEESKTN